MRLWRYQTLLGLVIIITLFNIKTNIKIITTTISDGGFSKSRQKR